MEVFNLSQEMTEQCQSLNLLYIEDDQEISAITAEMLKPFFNSITLAYDGIQGLEAFKKDAYDIVLTDIVMPRLNGLSLSRKIREINPLQAIIVMSAFEEMEYFREFIKIGISKFIAKPPEFQHLLDSFVSTAININNAKKVALLTQELKKDLYVNKELLHHIIDTVPVRIFWKDGDSRYLGCNALFAQDAGLSSASQIIGKTDHDLTWRDEASSCISDDQRVMDSDSPNLDYEEMNIQPNGKRQWLIMSKVPLHGEERELIGVLGTYINITAQKEAMIELQLAKDALGHQAQHDLLTGLPNRSLYMDRLNHTIQKSMRSQKKLAVMFIDLDRFKQINDTLGHEAGDIVVQMLGERLSSVLRDEDTIARFGGDEFTILLENITQVSAVTVVANKIVKTMEEPFEIDNHSLHLTLSAGISIYPDDGDSAEILIRNADTAMYRAKEEGRNFYTFYSKEMT